MQEDAASTVATALNGLIRQLEGGADDGIPNNEPDGDVSGEGDLDVEGVAYEVEEVEGNEEASQGPFGSPGALADPLAVNAYQNFYAMYAMYAPLPYNSLPYFC